MLEQIQVDFSRSTNDAHKVKIVIISANDKNFVACPLR